MIKNVLRLEGLSVLLLCLYLYGSAEFSWVAFGLFLLIPDLSMVGYLINKQKGAATYNVFHNYVFPLALYGVGYFTSMDLITMISLIWLAHIGMDRMLGYGLKYPTGFKDTHISHV